MIDLFYLIILPTVRLILRVFWYALLIRAVLSWMPDMRNAFTSFIYGITEPVLRPVRRITNRYGGASMPIDIAYLVVVLAVGMLMNVL